MHALGTVTGYTFEQTFQNEVGLAERLSNRFKFKKKTNLQLREKYPCQGFELISFFHSDICDLAGVREIEKIFPKELHKQHLPPTESNISLLEGVPKILITRRPDEIIESYRRVPRNSNDKIKKDLLRSDKFVAALKQELYDWSYGWKEKLDLLDDPFLEIRFDELFNSPSDTINSILWYLDFDRSVTYVPDGYELPKKRYYRV